MLPRAPDPEDEDWIYPPKTSLNFYQSTWREDHVKTVFSIGLESFINDYH
jgi:hypothetical protein